MCREELIDFDRYEIRKDGAIKSKFKNSEMTTSNTAYGYVINTFRKTDGKQETFARHRVIWFYFNGEIPKGMQIDHINGDKTDNRLENLRLVTPKENNNNPVTRQKMIETWSSVERNRKISEGNKGRKATQEQKDRQSKAMSGINHPFYGKKRPIQAQIMSRVERDKLGRWMKT